MGGIGGLASGASGGGGGAIGPGSIGGPVGRIELDGLPGAAPGAGGGGGGAIANGAILPSSEARSTATEGQGFSSGIDGQDGGDTTVSIGDAELRAAGGQGGLVGTGVRHTHSRLAVSALMLVNYAELREGLASIVGGGWQSLSVLNLPAPIAFPCTSSSRPMGSTSASTPSVSRARTGWRSSPANQLSRHHRNSGRYSSHPPLLLFDGRDRRLWPLDVGRCDTGS